MKKITALTVIAISITLAANSQKISASRVPSVVRSSFAHQFPGVKANWEKERGSYEAGFRMQGHNHSAMFSKDGVMTESEIEIKVAMLPGPAKEYIKKHKSGVVKSAAKITKASGEVEYEAELLGRDLLFDPNGKFLREVKN